MGLFRRYPKETFMKQLMLWVIALAASPTIVLDAQDIAGTWQGTLKPGPKDLRLVIKISHGDDKLKAVMYSIDQGGQPIPASAVARDGSTVKVTIAAINGSYEGKLSADGKSITGTWNQGAPLPLALARATPETTWTIPEPPPPPKRMPATAKPGVEVATIKPSDPSKPGKIFTVRGQDVVTINTTLNDLITMAYDIHAKQLKNGPGWLDSDKYDLTVKPDVPGQPNVAQIKMVIQKLLADRFQLKFHREKQELPVYTITQLSTGAKVNKSEADPNGLPGLFFGGGAHGTNFNVRNATMAEVASTLQGSILDRPVVDQTGLPEKYDFTLNFTPDPGQIASFGGPPRPPGATTEDPDAAPDLFTAFQRQLGLKLNNTKAPADVLVIDHVEKPSAN
jgi:uncharacterized protein (TIGR03435 family)